LATIVDWTVVPFAVAIDRLFVDVVIAVIRRITPRRIVVVIAVVARDDANRTNRHCYARARECRRRRGRDAEGRTQQQRAHCTQFRMLHFLASLCSPAPAREMTGPTLNPI